MNSLFTLADYRDGYANGSLTPSRAMAEVYRRIAAHDDPAIFISLRAIHDVLDDAAALERRGAAGLPLYGIPVAIKDNIDVAGIPTTAACPQFSYVPTADAAAVAKLRAAGAIIVGKTNLDQFATGLVGVRSPYGVPRNTFDAAMVPGGSSSGSAVAVAAGIVPLALGTDTAGSGRVPAALNNIVGLKPSLGTISTTGVVPACRSLDCVSIFALTVDDACAALSVISGFDETDAFSRRASDGTRDSSDAAVKIGVPDPSTLTFGGDRLAENAFATTIAGLNNLGAVTRAVNIGPMHDVAALLYDGPWVAERYEAIRALLEKNPDALLATTRTIIECAKGFSAADAFAGFYKLADLRRKTETLWQNIDILIVPTFPRPRTLADVARDPTGPNAELGTYTNFVNLLDLCALAVPAGIRADGFPFGITLIAPSGRDSLLARWGARIQSEFGTSLGATGRRQPDMPMACENAADAKTDSAEVQLAVVGAHLCGQPLNHELTDRGARFVRKARTTVDYHLFALTGGPPFRPGLLRTTAGTGHAIEVEVWALAVESFGDFVSRISAPLGIGVVNLDDGSSLKGFIVEAIATTHAQDISRFGSWPAFIKKNRAQDGT